MGGEWISWGRWCFRQGEESDQKRCKIENKIRLPSETGTGVELVLRWVSTAEERPVVGVARGCSQILPCCSLGMALGRVSLRAPQLKGLRETP